MTSPLAHLNGTSVPFSEASLPLHDAGFASGATVVDNARTFRRRLFRWPDHLARFRRDCATCYVPLTHTDGQLTAAAEEVVEHNAKLLPPGGELQLVTFATPGALGFYTGEPDGPPTLGMVTYPLPFARYRRFFTDGVRLAVAGALPPSLVPPTAKHRSRMAWHVAAHRVPPGTTAVLTDGAGNVTETAVANVLAVFDGVVTSPPRDTILDGISLRVTHELCAAAGLRWEERPIPVGEVASASEAMLTGTGFCVAGVRGFDGVELRWPGPVFTKLLAAWSDLVGVDVAAQFTA
jgi:branched-chain amino acid aminotransferase